MTTITITEYDPRFDTPAATRLQMQLDQSIPAAVLNQIIALLNPEPVPVRKQRKDVGIKRKEATL